MISFKEYTLLTEEAQDELLEEAVKKNTGRFKRVNRIRNGKVQRRHIVATKKGFTIRNGKVTRMKALERIHRKLAQRRGARKRKAKKFQALRKRKRSIRKAKAIVACIFCCFFQ